MLFFSRKQEQIVLSEKETWQAGLFNHSVVSANQTVEEVYPGPQKHHWGMDKSLNVHNGGFVGGWGWTGESKKRFVQTLKK